MTRQRTRSIVTLYRYFDADGKLLYAGVTSRLPERMADHRLMTPWFSEVATATFTHFDNVTAALLEEAKAIRLEQPRYNVRDATKDGQKVARKSVSKWKQYQYAGLPGLRYVRTAKGMSVTELARRCNVTGPFISRVEACQRNPSEDTLKLMCKALGCTEADLNVDYSKRGAPAIPATTATRGE